MFDDAPDATTKDETVESHALDEEECVGDFDAILASAVYWSKARDDNALSACMVVTDLKVPDQARHDYTVAERGPRDQHL